jgi:hypothetical protein
MLCRRGDEKKPNKDQTKKQSQAEQVTRKDKIMNNAEVGTGPQTKIKHRNGIKPRFQS